MPVDVNENVEQDMETPVVDDQQETVDQEVTDDPEATNEQESTDEPEVAEDTPLDPEAAEDDEPDVSEEVPETNDQPDWIDDDVRALADSYGLEEDDLLGFEGNGDFQRACRLLDRTMLRGQGSKTDEPESEPESTPTKEESSTEQEDLTLDLSQYEGYDDETLRVVKVAKQLQEENQAFRTELENMNQQMRAEFDQLHQERQEAMQEMELNRFHEVMDGMDEKLFGGSSPLNEEADSRRKAVWDSYNLILQNQGSESAPIDVMVRRAAMLAFGDEMLSAERNKIYNSINKQSRGRRPSPTKNKVVGDTATANDQKTIREAARQIANDPEFAKRFDNYQEDNGNAPD